MRTQGSKLLGICSRVAATVLGAALAGPASGLAVTAPINGGSDAAYVARGWAVEVAGALAAGASALISLELAPVEDRLSLGATGFLKALRRSLRRVFRILAWSTTQWLNWVFDLALCAMVALFAPLLDRTLVQTWREQGFRATRTTVTLALAVYLRLLLDRRSPALGKGLLVCAAIYSAAAADVVPDRLLPLGVMDDLVAVALASRGFMRLCPDDLIQEHARRAASARERVLRRRTARSPLAGETR